MWGLFRLAAGKASPAIDAALEAVRRHWIEKEMKQSARPADATPPASGKAFNAAAAAAAAAKSPAGPPPEGVATAAAGIQSSAAAGGEPERAAAPAGQQALADRLANRSVSRIFSSRARQLGAITESAGAVASDDDEE